MNPLVSIIIPVHNTLPYLHRTMHSCLAQSIDSREVEIIAVDDGSTDGSGEFLDHFASLHPENVQVVHRPASGGPSEPRNHALDIARGRYVYFLDADDYLGTEALERLTGFADLHGSDIVLGKPKGRNGRKVDNSLYTADIATIELHKSKLYWHIEVWKLFRREFLERESLRFPVDMVLGEDQPFTFQAYSRASRISVISSYTCLYQVLREDRSNLICETRWSTQERCALHLDLLSRMTDLVGSNTSDVRRRDHLLLRHWEYEGYNLLLVVKLLSDRTEQLQYLSGIQKIMATWYSEWIGKHLDPELATVYRHLQSGNFPEVLELIAPFEATYETKNE